MARLLSDGLVPFFSFLSASHHHPRRQLLTAGSLYHHNVKPKSSLSLQGRSKIPGHEEEAYYLPRDEAEVDGLGKVVTDLHRGRDVENMYQISSMKSGG